jgi:hypothetical protein
MDPNPGIRALGFFAEVDTFVALTWNYRENIEGASGWINEVTSCITKWQELFGTLSPHKGNTINDYVSYNIQAV